MVRWHWLANDRADMRQLGAVEAAEDEAESESEYETEVEGGNGITVSAGDRAKTNRSAVHQTSRAGADLTVCSGNKIADDDVTKCFYHLRGKNRRFGYPLPVHFSMGEHS